MSHSGDAPVSLITHPAATLKRNAMSVTDRRQAERTNRVGSRIMVDEMMVSAERALLARAAERGWIAEQAAADRGRATFSIKRLHHVVGATMLRVGARLQSACGVTPAGVMLACRLAVTR
jgi:hypothetical protein